MKKHVMMTLCCILICTSVAFSKDIEITKGLLRLVVHEQSGTFSLYSYSPATKKSVALIDTYAYSSSTSFSLLIDKSIRNLIRDSGVSAVVKKSNDDITIIYNIKKQAEVNVNFSFLASEDNGVEDILCVTVTTQNTSDVTKNIGIKFIMDTCLGERASTHFSTAVRGTVNSEFLFENMEYEKWIRSSDGKTSVQLLLNGNDVTKPDVVAVGAKDILSTGIWTPVIQRGRSFNSILAYNNSAISSTWKTFQVTPLTKTTIRFYLSTAIDGKTPPDASVLDKIHPVAQKTSLTENDEVTYIDESGVVFTLGALTEDQLDPTYIQDLLNRIQSMQSSTIVDKDEIIRLNAELDAILEKMRKM